MENKNIVMIKHHPMNVFFTNTFYTNQFGAGENPADYIMFDVTSRNKDASITHDLSPFFIGPATSSYDVTFKNFENLWQFSKVYEGDTIFNYKPSLKKEQSIPFVCSDNMGNPTEKWWEFNKVGADSSIAYRRPYVGKPLYQYYQNARGEIERLDYVTSRKKVYIPEYAKLVYNTPSFKKLKELVDNGGKIAIIDFDAYNYYNPAAMERLYASIVKKYPNFTYTLDDFLAIKTVKDVVNFTGLLAGHGFVLKMLLQGDLEVKNGEVIDNSSVLN